jgi:hypothetical protein
MALYAARICFDVSYHANEDEMTTHGRIERVAEAMLLLLRRSPRINVVSIEPGGIECVEQEHE